MTVCTPESLSPNLAAQGDVVVVRRGTTQSIGRIEDVSSGDVFSLRQPSGTLTTFSKTDIQARVCR